MSKILATIKAEPVLVVGLVSAILTAVAAFGLHLSKEQTGAIVLVVNAALAVVGRGMVTPNTKAVTTVVDAATPAAPPAQ